MAKPGAPRRSELPLQMIDLLLEALSFALQSRPLVLPPILFVPQRVTLAFRPLGPIAPSAFARRFRRLGRLRRFRHVPVMPEFARRYKTPLINYVVTDVLGSHSTPPQHSLRDLATDLKV